MELRVPLSSMSERPTPRDAVTVSTSTSCLADLKSATCYQKFLKISNPHTRNFECHMHSGGAQAVHSCRQRHGYEHNSAQARDSRCRVQLGRVRLSLQGPDRCEIALLDTAPKAFSRSTHALPCRRRPATIPSAGTFTPMRLPMKPTTTGYSTTASRRDPKYVLLPLDI